MAYVSDTTPDKDKENADQSGMNTVSTGQSAQIAGGQAPAQESTQKGGSGQFTNIQDYIQANKPKTQQLAQNITGNVQKQAQDVRSATQQQQEQFTGQQGIYGDKAQQTIQQSIQQAGKQPDQDISQFRAYATGKAGTADFSKQQQQATDLQRQAKQLETSKGRQEQLQKVVGKAPTYTAGQQGLDRMLLAGDRESKLATIRGAREAVGGLGQQVEQANTQVEQARQQAQQQAQQQLAEARKSEQERLTGQYERLRGGLQSGQLSQEDLQKLGLEAGQRTYGVNLADVLDQNKAATPEDIARLDALAKLGGLEGRETFQGIQGGDIVANVQQALGEKQKAYEQEIVDPTKQRDIYARLAQMAKDAWRKDLRVEEYDSGEDNMYKFGNINMYGGNFGNIWNRMRPELGGAYSPAEMRVQQALQEQGTGGAKIMTRDNEGVPERYVDTSNLDFSAFDRLDDPYVQQLAAIEGRYGGTIGQAPPAVEDGGIIESPKMRALKKMRGY